MLAKLVALDTSQREMSSLNVFCVMVSPTQPDYSPKKSFMNNCTRWYDNILPAAPK